MITDKVQYLMPGLEKEMIHCKNCSSKKVVKHGYNFTSRGKVQRYFCKDCNHNFN